MAVDSATTPDVHSRVVFGVAVGGRFDSRDGLAQERCGLSEGRATQRAQFVLGGGIEVLVTAFDHTCCTRAQGEGGHHQRAGVEREGGADPLVGQIGIVAAEQCLDHRLAQNRNDKSLLRTGDSERIDVVGGDVVERRKGHRGDLFG
jgi:hypothetical protein